MEAIDWKLFRFSAAVKSGFAFSNVIGPLFFRLGDSSFTLYGSSPNETPFLTVIWGSSVTVGSSYNPGTTQALPLMLLRRADGLGFIGAESYYLSLSSKEFDRWAIIRA